RAREKGGSRSRPRCCCYGSDLLQLHLDVVHVYAVARHIAAYTHPEDLALLADAIGRLQALLDHAVAGVVQANLAPVIRQQHEGRRRRTDEAGVVPAARILRPGFPLRSSATPAS